MQLIYRSTESKVDRALLNRSIQSKIDDGLRLRWIHKLNCATIQNKPVTLENEIAAIRIDSPEDHRLCGGAMNLQICGAIDAQRSANQANVIRGMDSQIQLNILANSSRWRRADFSRKLIDEFRQIECGVNERSVRSTEPPSNALSGVPASRIFAFTLSRTP